MVYKLIIVNKNFKTNKLSIRLNTVVNVIFNFLYSSRELNLIENIALIFYWKLKMVYDSKLLSIKSTRRGIILKDNKNKLLY